MKTIIYHNDFKKEILIDITKNNGLIQEEILNLCLLIIYNIEKTEIIINNKIYILGIDNLLFNDTFDTFLNINNLINETINKIIVYDRKRDDKGNVLKENKIINNYNDWYKIYQNENYINYLNNSYNDNRIEIPFNLFLENIFRIPNNSNLESTILNSDNSINILENLNNILDTNTNNILDTNTNNILDTNTNNILDTNTNNILDTINNENFEDNIDISFKITLNNILNYDNNDILRKEEIINIIDKKIKELEYENNVIENNVIENNLIENNVIENNVIENNVIENNVIENNVIENNVIENNSNSIFRSDMNNIINIFDNYIQNTNYNRLEENFFNILNRDINLNYDNFNSFNHLTSLISDNEQYNIDYNDNIYLNNLDDVKIILKEETFNNLECKLYKELNFNDLKECLICIEEFKDDDILTKIKCSHIFHKNCIKHWLCEESNKCPICRIEVDNNFIYDNNDNNH